MSNKLCRNCGLHFTKRNEPSYQCHDGMSHDYDDQIYTEAEHEKIVQEKLRQQRDKCAEAYDNASGDGVIQKQIIKAAIRNATIDNNGEEG